MNRNYVENVCAMLRRNGWASKYEHAGIYCIKLKEQIVYIGKSQNMLERVAAHYVGIMTGSERKYRIIFDAAQQLNCTIDFDVLYNAQETSKEGIAEEIGRKEGELIRQHRPPLNTQIPRESNWRSWDVRTLNTEEVLRLLVNK